MDDAAKKKAKLRSAVRRLLNAEVEYSWRGAAEPGQREYIERELRNAKARYERVLSEVFTEPTNG